MPEETNSATLAPPVDDSYEAWEQTQQKAPPAQEPKATEKTETPSVPIKGQTAAVPETAQPQEQKPKQQLQPKRKHDAESRIAELTKENAEFKRQLEESRKNSVSQVSQPAPESPKPASQSATLPKLSEYVKAEHLKRPDVLQEDLIEEWVQKRDDQAEQTRQAKAGQERINKAMSDFRAKHPDTADAVFNDVILGTREANVMGPLMANFPNWPDVLHYLHENQELYQQVRASSPQEQWYDVVAIARQLSRGAIATAQEPTGQPAQEQPRNVRPISRIPAPARHTLGGGMPPEARSIRDARDFEEAEAIERRRASGGR